MSHHRGRRAKGASSAAIPAPPSAPAPLLPPVPQPPTAPPGAVQTMEPMTVALPVVPPPVVPRPQVALVPSGRGQRKAAQRDERRKTMRRGSIVAGVLVAVGAVVAGLLVTTGGGKKPQAAVTPPDADGRTQHTLLLTLAPAAGASVESVLLAHDTAGKGQGQFVLVPSNILTEVAGHGSMSLGDAAPFGVTVPAETLSDMMSVTIDASWQLTPAGLAALIDHLGGVTVDVADDVTVNNQVVLSAGAGQHLAGAQAVQLATYIDADEPSGARLARFESVLVAVMAKLGTDASAVKANLAAVTAGSALGGKTADVAPVLAGLDADAAAQNVNYTNVPTTVLDTGAAQEQLALDGTATAALVKSSFANSIPQGRVPGRNRVIVFNGTGQLGLGSSARQRLLDHGLVFVRSANQPGFGYQAKPSVVLIPDATPDSVAAGQRVAKALGLPVTDVETSTVDATAADVYAILGADYKP
jgi:anionic cell wall polymer biosynthesis LytR-Cps2A-Psr (LCP) family protein